MGNSGKDVEQKKAKVGKEWEKKDALDLVRNANERDDSGAPQFTPNAQSRDEAQRAARYLGTYIEVPVAELS